MKKISVFLLVFLNSILVVSAQEDARKQADRYNRLAKDNEAKVDERSIRDSVLYYNAIYNDVNYSLKSDEFDRMPNRRNKVQPKLEEDNKMRLNRLYPILIDAGKYLAKQDNTRSQGIDALNLYLSARKSPLLVGSVDESGVASYYLAYYYLKAKDYKHADQYANEALKYDETAKAAADVKAECMYEQMTCEIDSVKYLAVLKHLYNTDPTNEKYFSWIMRFYQKPTAKFNLEDFVDGRLEENANSPIPWILKGEIAMHAERWEEAVDAYKQADELDPTRIPLIYNIGVCLNQLGMQMRDSVMAQKKKGEIVSETLYTRFFAEARNYLERVRAKDPRRNKVDWVGPLYMDYTILDDKIKANELEPMLETK